MGTVLFIVFVQDSSVVVSPIQMLFMFVEVVEETKKGKAAEKKAKVEVVEEIIPRPTDEEEVDFKKYGREWIFVNYFREEEE